MITMLPTMKMMAARRIFERSSGGSWGGVDSVPSFARARRDGSASVQTIG